ncbi:acyl-CoA dehydrogenase/oxidase [Penicillium macrosclerotiorum]|uniref:acyl-CoA dehydrogenase/oxidase n=1 Tax=Penicillium macrosclerotiorum TaxID=303699 RepID=UPI00254968DB|nr:acyl-CoA dehydrogenase/oxidase [Penicillium macrosclerotiorum]KAJ5689860.1 acyl-CoA dehydrogenase/oxidase [Penicillium macrosclerotiorum]
MPESRQPTSLIARHENGMFEECDALIKGLSGSHRGPEFNNAILPRCKGLIEAIGQRMAYEAASEAQVDPKILALYEAGVILHDSGWYIQNAGLTREVQFENESRALSDCLPQLEDLLDETGVAEYVNAPILSKESWDEYVSTLVTFESPPVTHAVNTQLQCRANL